MAQSYVYSNERIQERIKNNNQEQEEELAIVVGDRYKLTRSIGKGSFGEVFEGVDLISNNMVAIKLVSRRLTHKQLKLTLNNNWTAGKNKRSQSDPFLRSTNLARTSEYSTALRSQALPSWLGGRLQCSRLTATRTEPRKPDPGKLRHPIDLVNAHDWS